MLAICHDELRVLAFLKVFQEPIAFVCCEIFWAVPVEDREALAEAGATCLAGHGPTLTLL